MPGLNVVLVGFNLMSAFKSINLQPKALSLAAVAELVHGQLAASGSQEISDVCSLDESAAGKIAFLRDRELKRAKEILGKGSANGYQLPAALLVHTSCLEQEWDLPVALIGVSDPVGSFAKLSGYFHPKVTLTAGIHPTAVIEEGVELGENIAIGAFCYIGQGSKIGSNTTLMPRVTIYPGVSVGEQVMIHAHVVIREGTVIGSGCTLHAGAVIGADGFGYAPDERGNLIAVPQIGTVQIGDNVDIGACSCVDRATIGTTEVGSGSKLDNFVQVGHNVKIGKHAIVCAHTGIGGSAVIGDRVVLGGQSGVADHCSVVAGSRVSAKGGVISKLTERGDYAGFPAIPASDWRRQMAALRKLPELIRQRKATKED